MQVWIEARVRWYMSMPQEAFALEFRKAEARLHHAEACMKALVQRIDHYATKGAEGFLELAGLLVDMQARSRPSPHLGFCWRRRDRGRCGAVGSLTPP